jgi:hypothetical protein
MPRRALTLLLHTVHVVALFKTKKIRNQTEGTSSADSLTPFRYHITDIKGHCGALVFTYIYPVAYYNNRDLRELDKLRSQTAT